MLSGGDTLARGARSAQFVSAGSAADEEVVLRNVASEEEVAAAEQEKIELGQVKIDRTRSYKRITPKQDQILVQRRDPEELSAGGLYIPSESKERPAEGVIISIGPKVQDLKVGDHILFGKYSGTEYPFGSEVLLFMREDEVISTVEE